MSNQDKKIDALMRLALADSPSEKERIREEISNMISPVTRKPRISLETCIREILLEIGAPDALVGFPYMLTALSLTVTEPTIIRKMTKEVYPQVSRIHNSTPGRVERGIRHLIEVIWLHSDPDVLYKYFGNTIKADKGKPTNREFITRIANVIRQAQKEAE